MNDMKKTTLTLEPDAQKLDSSLFGTMPSMSTVDLPVASKTYSVGSIDENMLSAEEKEMVEDFANQIYLYMYMHAYMYIYILGFLPW